MRMLLITLAFATLSTGCIGGESGEPPVVGIRNMYNQPRYDTQERQPFFADQRSMRPQVEGTVSREMEKAMAIASGRNANDDAWLMEVHPQLVAPGPPARLDITERVPVAVPTLGQLGAQRAALDQ